METASTVDEQELLASPQDEVLIRLVADFADDGVFGHRTLEVTREAAQVIEPSGAVSCRVPIAAIKTARNEPLVGGGRLELVTKAGDFVVLVSYSLTLAAKFSEAARGIEQLAKGRAAPRQPEGRATALREVQSAPAGKGRHLPGLRQPRQDDAAHQELHATLPGPRVDAGAAFARRRPCLNLLPPLIQGKLIDGVLSQPPRPANRSGS